MSAEAIEHLCGAGVSYPGDRLIEWAAGIVEDVRSQGGDEDEIAEIADSAVPVYDADVIALISEGGLYRWQPEIEPAEQTIISIAQAVLYGVAHAIACQAVDDLAEVGA